VEFASKCKTNKGRERKGSGHIGKHNNGEEKGGKEKKEKKKGVILEKNQKALERLKLAEKKNSAKRKKHIPN